MGSRDRPPARPVFRGTQPAGSRLGSAGEVRLPGDQGATPAARQHRLGEMRRSLMQWVLALSTSLLLACGGKSDLSETGGGGSGGAGGGSGGLDGLGCPDSGPCVETSCGDEPCTWDCDLPELCPEVTFNGQGGFGPSGGVTDVSSVDDAHCIAAALRDGTEGTVAWKTDIWSTAGTDRRGMIVHLRPGRLALVRASSSNLGGAPVNLHAYSARGPLTLEPAATYDACLALAEPAALHDCLTVGPCD